MARTRKNLQRQSQLSFTPLPASSPATAEQPESIRHRAAAVVISGSPSAGTRKATMRDYLPSPATSSQTLPASRRMHNNSPTPRRSTRNFIEGRHSSEVNTSSPRKRRKIAVINDFDDSESDTSIMQSSPTRKRTTSALRGTASQVDRRGFVPEPYESSQEDDSRRAKRRSVTSLSDDEEPDNSAEPGTDNTEDNDGATVDGGAEDFDDEEDDMPIRRTRRGLAQSPTPTKPKNAARDQADLDEDLDFLGTADTESPRALRAHGSSAAKSAKQLALEALRRRRRNRASNGGGQVQDTEPNEEGNEQLSREGSVSIFDDSGQSDFVVEDEGEELGAVELPFQFSQYRTMKLKDLFKFVVEWMVQKKINPAFAMQDDVYTIAFNRSDDFVRGLGGSKFQSAAWTPKFSRMLRTRPVLEDHQSTMFSDHCDACNRSGHPATWRVRFAGKTYDKDTLEEDSDSEDDEEEDVSDEKLSSNITFYIGKFCMRNARTAHALAHWKYHLKEWVVDYLKDKGELVSEKIVRRDGWSTKKRRKDAERIVDEMERVGEIRNLYRDFKNEINNAQAEQQYSGRNGSSP